MTSSANSPARDAGGHGDAHAVMICDSSFLTSGSETHQRVGNMWETNIAKQAWRAGTKWSYGNSYANSIFAGVSLFYSVCFFLLKKRKLEELKQCPLQRHGNVTAGLIPPGKIASQALPAVACTAGLRTHKHFLGCSHSHC